MSFVEICLPYMFIFIFMYTSNQARSFFSPSLFRSFPPFCRSPLLMVIVVVIGGGSGGGVVDVLHGLFVVFTDTLPPQQHSQTHTHTHNAIDSRNHLTALSFRSKPDRLRPGPCTDRVYVCVSVCVRLCMDIRISCIVHFIHAYM